MNKLLNCKRFAKNLTIFFLVFTVFMHNICLAFNEITNLENDKIETKTKITETKEKIDEISGEKEKTLEQVKKLINQISEYQDDIDDLNTNISNLQTKIADTEKQIKKDEEEYKKEDKALDERLVAMYEAGETSYLDFLLSSASLVDFISSYYLISEVIDYDTKMLEQLENHKQKIENEKKGLEYDKKELSNSKTILESKQKELAAIKKDKEAQASKLSNDEKKLEQQLSELTSHEQSISKKIKDLQKKYDEENKKSARLSSSKSSEKTNSYSDDISNNYGFSYPVKNHYIGTDYGVSGRYWSSGHHTGIDFPVQSGTPVYSIGNGQVVDCGKNKAYGNFVEIYHGNNIYSFYAHASKYIVNVGQYVSKGQQIMYSGATGNVTAAHLHFEIRTPGPRYANCVNPRKYLE